MIRCKITSHCGARTIEYACEHCGRINVRCFGVKITRELHEKTCWFCSKKQPALLDLVHHQTERVQYHFPTITHSVVSGIY